jgi:hypothetical protein
VATTADILAAADFGRTYIKRLASGYVTIQEEAPWEGKYGTGWVEHCDLSVGWVYNRAGLGRDEYANEGYTVTSVNRYRAGNGKYRGDLKPRLCDSGYIDWGDYDGLGGSASATDHVELVTGPLLLDGSGNPVVDADGIPLVDTSGGFVETIGWNTTPDGQGYRFRRPLSLFVAFGHPRLDSVVKPPDPPKPVGKVPLPVILMEAGII